MENQRKIVDYFKQFVNNVLLKHFKGSQQTMTQWNYFSSLMTQQNVDFNKVHVYLNVLSPVNKQEFKASTQQTIPQQKKTNSGIYKKDCGGDTNVDFVLNRTVGGNADRIKFTGMFPTKTFGVRSFENKQKEKQKQKKLKETSSRVNPTMFTLIQGIQQMHNKMSENHNKMQTPQSYHSKSTVGETQSSYQYNGGGSGFSNGNGNYFYKQKPQERIY